MEYYLIGWYIVHIGVSRRNTKLLYCLGLFVLAIELIATPIVSYKMGVVYKPIYDIANLPTVIVMTALFLFLSNLNDGLSTHTRFLRSISRLTFGIYLLHPFLILGLDQFLKISSASLHIVVFPLIVYGVSAVLVWGIQKIPFAKCILP